MSQCCPYYVSIHSDIRVPVILILDPYMGGLSGPDLLVNIHPDWGSHVPDLGFSVILIWGPIDTGLSASDLRISLIPI
ncbi:hypothetical protein BgiMline_032152 [Biomphalaria glabrata]|nr:hypothetical protein BgiMline_028708 [Biomphalaria glabrata]